MQDTLFSTLLFIGFYCLYSNMFATKQSRTKAVSHIKPVVVQAARPEPATIATRKAETAPITEPTVATAALTTTARFEAELPGLTKATTGQRASSSQSRRPKGASRSSSRSKSINAAAL